MSSIEQTLHKPPSEHIFSRFPVEVVRLIFEISATYSARTAVSLTYVSKLVRTWVLPIFYESLGASNKYELFSTLTSSAPHSQPLALFIRNICINNGTYPTFCARFERRHCPPSTTVVSLLRICPNLQNLHTNYPHAPFDYPPNLHPHLTHLHCGYWVAWLSQGYLSFTSLTHLRVHIASDSSLTSSWAPLLPPSTSLPNLTHLAFSTDRRTPSPSELSAIADFTRRVLTRPKIVMFVACFWYCWGSDPGNGRFVDLFAGGGGGGRLDPRLCVLLLMSTPYDGSSSVQEWENEVHGRDSLWDEADAVMKRHREDGRKGVPVGLLETEIIDYR